MDAAAAPSGRARRLEDGASGAGDAPPGRAPRAGGAVPALSQHPHPDSCDRRDLGELLCCSVRRRAQSPASEAHADDAERREVPQPPPARHASPPPSHAHPVLPRRAQSDMGDPPAEEDEEAESARARSDGESEADDDLEDDEVDSDEETDVSSDDEMVCSRPRGTDACTRRTRRATSRGGAAAWASARAANEDTRSHSGCRARTTRTRARAPHSRHGSMPQPHSQPPRPRAVAPRPAAPGSLIPRSTLARRR